jgi:hypothetical protein
VARHKVLDASPIEFRLKDWRFSERAGQLQLGETGGLEHEDPVSGRVDIRIDCQNIATNNRRAKRGVEGYLYEDPAATIGHEFAHAYDYLFGWPAAPTNEAAADYVGSLIQGRLGAR